MGCCACWALLSAGNECSVVEEIIPETQRTGNIDTATIGFIGGFTVMALDNAFK